ncbi:MAG: hypothetical protein Q9201_000830 [Fulgogasparrea decipioides]
MAHWHTYTITDALNDKTEGTAYTLPTPSHERRRLNPLPDTLSNSAPTPTPVVTVYNVFDGKETHDTTSTLPLTTRAPTTIITSGVTKTISGTTAAVTDYGMHVYPADGCWDDPKCWYSKTHSEPTPTPSNPVVKGYNYQNQPSADNSFLQIAPYLGIPLVFGLLLVLSFFLAGRRYRAKKQKRSDDARARQSKRMGSADNSPGAENPENPETPIELEPMDRSQDSWRQERQR